MAKKTNLNEEELPVSMPKDYNPANDTMQRIRIEQEESALLDVSRYSLPEELEERLSWYEEGFEKFCKHVRIAHKIAAKRSEARNEAAWRVEAKYLDEASGQFTRFGETYRETVPTPQELRDKGLYGRVCLVLRYWTPYKAIKGNVKHAGIQIIRSEPFDIIAPNNAPARSATNAASGSGAIPLPPAGAMADFHAMIAQTQQTFLLAQNMVAQAAALQMDALANRGKIEDAGFNRGIEIGKLREQNEQIAREYSKLKEDNERLLKQQNEMIKNTGLVTAEDDDDEEDEKPDLFQRVTDFVAPMIQQALNPNANTAAQSAPNQPGPEIPPQTE
jgi:hypothetical protein